MLADMSIIPPRFLTPAITLIQLGMELRGRLRRGPVSAGMNIVSPQWVLRSAASGSLQRVLTMSMDASRQLPSGCPAVAAGAGDAGAGAAGLGAAHATVPADRSAREALVQSLGQHGERSTVFHR